MTGVRSASVGLALVVAFVAAGAATLGRYGVTWDEALGDLYFGDVYLAFFQSGCDFDRLPPGPPKPPEHWSLPGQPAIAQSVLRDSPFHFWPVGNLVVAAFGEVFDRRLHWLNPIDARHLGIVFLGALALAAVWTFAREAFGTTAAAAAVLILGTFPEFFSLSHDVVKDVGECALYSWTLVAFWRAWLRLSFGWLAAAAVLFGLALGTKLNAAFAVATLALWLSTLALFPEQGRSPAVPRRPNVPDRSGRSILRGIAALAAVVVVGFGVFVASWPWLWPDIFGRLAEHARVFREVAGGGPDSWQLAPVAEAFVRTPPALLAAFAAGLVACVAWPRARAQGRAVLLLLLWMAVPIVRCAAPGFRNYDGIRRFLEYLPAFAILGGVGVAAACDAIGSRLAPRARTALACAVALAVVAHSIWIDVRLHPNQHAYLNTWKGDRVPGDNWGGSFRDAIGWINKNAELGASIFAPIGQHMIEVMAPVLLRPDVVLAQVKSDASKDSILPVTTSWPSRGRPRYAILLNRPQWSERAWAWLAAHEPERWRIEADGQPILLIFQLRPGDFEPETR